MTKFLEKELLKRFKIIIKDFFFNKIKFLYYQKMKNDLRYQGILMDDTQPVFMKQKEIMPADVLFCAINKKNINHHLISYGSSGDYVHVAIYIGDGQVIEAIKGGIVQNTLEEVLSRYPYIAVCRCPGVDANGSDLSKKVVEFCMKKKESKTKFSIFGAMKSPLHELLYLKYRKQDDWTKRMNRPPRVRPQNKFFCSQFVIEAFKYGGYIQEYDMESHKYSPSALAEDNTFYLKGYLGDAEKAMYIRKNDYFLTGGVPLK